MNLLDGLILVPILYFAFKGFRNGLIKEVFSLAGIILAIFICLHYTDKLNNILLPYFFKSKSYLPYVSAIILFIATLIFVEVIIYALNRVVIAVDLGILNRSLGLLFGIFKTSLFLSIILVLLAGFDLPNTNARNQSVTYPYIVSLAPETYSLITKVIPGADNYSKTLKKTLDQYNPLSNDQKTDNK